ncbi:hypothetical protein BH10PLA2_BH10PLA2_21710 [soil metagenome]
MRIYLNSRPFSFSLLVTVCLLSSSGCGSSESVVPVSGLVTHNGQPVPGLVVSFVPQTATQTGVSMAETDDNGKYDLKVVKSGKSGAVVGTHKVWVSRPRQPLNEAGDKEERAKLRKERKKPTPTDKPPPDLAAIIKKYGSLDKSTLTFEVKGGSPIDLKLD